MGVRLPDEHQARSTGINPVPAVHHAQRVVGRLEQQRHPQVGGGGPPHAVVTAYRDGAGGLRVRHRQL